MDWKTRLGLIGIGILAGSEFATIWAWGELIDFKAHVTLHIVSWILFVMVAFMAYWTMSLAVAIWGGLIRRWRQRRV